MMLLMWVTSISLVSDCEVTRIFNIDQCASQSMPDAHRLLHRNFQVA